MMTMMMSAKTKLKINDMMIMIPRWNVMMTMMMIKINDMMITMPRCTREHWDGVLSSSWWWLDSPGWANQPLWVSTSNIQDSKFDNFFQLWWHFPDISPFANLQNCRFVSFYCRWADDCANWNYDDCANWDYARAEKLAQLMQHANHVNLAKHRGKCYI